MDAAIDVIALAGQPVLVIGAAETLGGMNGVTLQPGPILAGVLGDGDSLPLTPVGPGVAEALGRARVVILVGLDDGVIAWARRVPIDRAGPVTEVAAREIDAIRQALGRGDAGFAPFI